MPKRKLAITRIRHLHVPKIVSAATLTLLVVVMVLLAVRIRAVTPTQRYVHPTAGIDTGSCADIALPCKTFQYTAKQAQPGDILLVRGGTYVATSTNSFTIQNIPGSSTVRTVLKPYPGETVILDGGNVAFSDTQALLQLSNVDNFEVVGLEVRNSVGRGIAYFESQNIRIADNKIHGIYSRALGGWADGAILENNEVYNSALSNLGNACNPCSGGWPGVVQTASRWGTGPPHEPSRNITIRNNYIHDNWGEGIISDFTDGITIVNNRVANNYSVNIYLSHSRNVTLDRNYIYVDSDVFNRTGRHASGITFASESDDPDVPMIKSENITITNNIISGTGNGIGYWKSPLVNSVNSYSNITILHNTIHAIALLPFYIDHPSGDPAGPVTVRNNIISKGGNGYYTIGDLGVWTFANNIWVPTKPTVTAFVNDYQMTSIPYINPVTGGDPNGFGLTTQLPYLGASANVTSDYFNFVRSVSNPTIGAVEFGSTSPTNTPLPVVSVTPTLPAPSATPNATGTPTRTLTPTRSPTPTPAVGDIIPPKVTISTPSDGSTLPKTGNVSVRVTASDASGISSITIFVDGVQKTKCTGATSCNYSMNVKKLSMGTHTISATALDNSPSRNSQTTTITVTK